MISIPIEDLSCSICKEEYDTDNRRPNINSCGHTYCSSCWKSFRNPICPNCSKSLIVEPMTNYFILTILGNLPKKEQNILPENSNWAPTKEVIDKNAPTDTDTELFSYEQQQRLFSYEHQLLPPSTITTPTPPPTTTTKTKKTKTTVAITTNAKRVEHIQSGRLCKFFNNNGSCNKGAQCKFLHQGSANVISKRDLEIERNKKDKEATAKKELEKQQQRQQRETEKQKEREKQKQQKEEEMTFNVFNYARENQVTELRNALNQGNVCSNWYLDPAGFNALHVATQGGNIACVEALLEKKCPFDIKAKSNGFTPLHYASRFGFESIVKMLLVINANVNIKNHEGFTPLHLAAKFDFPNIVMMLVEGGADVASKSNQGLTAANVATKNVTKKCAKLISTISVRTKVQEYTPKGVLHFAFSRNIENLRLALKYGNNSTSSWYTDDHTGLTALHCGFLDAMEVLLDSGFDVNCNSCDGSTALHKASYNGHEETINFLLDRGADINIKNRAGGTAMSAAVRGRHISCIRLLFSRGASINNINTALGQAVVSGDADIVAVLCELGAVVSVKLISKAISCNLESVVNILCNFIDNINIKNDDGSTLLLVASRLGRTEIAKMLILARNADVNAKNDEEMTPLIESSTAGHIGIVKMLLEKKTNDDYTKSFLLAVSNCHLKVGLEILDHLEENAFGSKEAMKNALVRCHWFLPTWARRNLWKKRKENIIWEDVTNFAREA